MLNLHATPPRAATTARAVLDAFRLRGHAFATGVPCSLLAGLFAELERPDGDLGIAFAAAPREDSAVGVATGAELAGRRSLVLMQNSGLGYCLNVLTSLNMIYGLPLPLVVSWRGREPEAVEHDVIGARLPDLAAAFALPFTVLDAERPAASVDEALDRMEATGRPSILAVGEKL